LILLFVFLAELRPGGEEGSEGNEGNAGRASLVRVGRRAFWHRLIVP